jgi:hypothetical protein
MYFPIPKLDLQQPTLMGQLTALGKWAEQRNLGRVEIQKSCGGLCYRLGMLHDSFLGYSGGLS